jgi:hypothetical protein
MAAMKRRGPAVRLAELPAQLLEIGCALAIDRPAGVRTSR